MEQVLGKCGHHTEVVRQFEIRIERPKPGPLDELIALLKKILHYCACVLTCGCVPPPATAHGINGHEYGTHLLDSEKVAVENLLTYLESEGSCEAVMSTEHLRALSILTFSDNEDLQRSAALCFIEFSEKMNGAITGEMATLLLELLRSPDQQVQKVASVALSNFILAEHDVNMEVVIVSGVIAPLVTMLNSQDPEIQCNACGCLAALAAQDNTMQELVNTHGLKPLLSLLTSPDISVQRNAAGTILNLTHSQSNRDHLVRFGVLPLLVDALHKSDEEIQYYCSAALGNFAVNEKHRAMMVAVGNQDVILQLIQLLYARQSKIKCQVCYAVRNLASDSEQQVLLVKHGILGALHKVIISALTSRLSPVPDMLAAAVGCLRNLSLLKANELSIVGEDFLPELCKILQSGQNWEAQRHAAGTIRNLAVGNHIQAVMESECLISLCTCLIDIKTRPEVHADLTAAIAVLTDEDDVKSKLVSLWNGQVFGRLVSLASLSVNNEVQYNSASILGQIAQQGIPDALRDTNQLGIVLYIDKFLKSQDPNFIHIGLWSLSQLLKDDVFLSAFKEHHIDHIIIGILMSSHPPAILELAESVRDFLGLGEEEEEEEENKTAL